MSDNNFSQTAAYIWSVADLLRGSFKQSQYGRVILPFALLRRLECVLEPCKGAVAAEYERIRSKHLLEKDLENTLLSATQTPEHPNGLPFFCTSQMTLGEIEPYSMRSYLELYIQSFSKDVREIFEHFMFEEHIGLLDDANLLFMVVRKFSCMDLSSSSLSNYEMGLVFEELIRRFAQSSNETVGEIFTPRDIVSLTTSLVLCEDNETLMHSEKAHSVYDPTVGTGGFLSSTIEYMHELNPKVMLSMFGQELNPESYAICKANMLIKGQDITQIKLGNTLSNDQLPATKFDYILSSPPFGMDWKRVESEIKSEHERQGPNGRFGAGLPRLSDSSLLFLMHMISKMKDLKTLDNEVVDGSRIGIVLSGSSLFTGGAGSGESKIRRYILEADLLEAVISLPTEMFYNTGIATYVWVLSNKKKLGRKGKVQLINGSKLSSKMRKSLGSKRRLLNADEIRAITQNFSDFMEVDAQTESGKTLTSKIFDSYEFGYRRLTIERPLRLSVQVTDRALESLRFAPKPLGAAMQAVYTQFGNDWTEQNYGSLVRVEAEVRSLLKADFPELKEGQIKSVLDSQLWLSQKVLLESAKVLQVAINENYAGDAHQFDDFNYFDSLLKKSLKETGIKLSRKQKNQFIDAVSWKNQVAKPVIKREVKKAAQPKHGTFAYSGEVKEWQGKVVEFKPDGELRDQENIPLDPNFSTSHIIESYYQSELCPSVADAWINTEFKDDQDHDVGVVGYEINFRSYFQRSYSRDELLEGKLVRLKDVVQVSENGLYVLDSASGKMVEFSNLSEKRKALSPTRFDLLPNTLLADFYNIFLQQEEGSDWLDSNFMSSSSWKNVSMSSWLNARISVPPISNQSSLIDLWFECDAVLTRVELLKKSAFSDFQTAQEQILPYQSVASRYEQEFSSMLPTPLAILWELAESKFNERERVEAFIKIYEYLGLYLVSVVFGYIAPSQKTLYTTKGLKSLTMAFSHNRLSEHARCFTDSNSLVSSLCHNEITQLLSQATELRNDIAHRGLPSAELVRNAKETIQSLNEKMQSVLRSFFEITALIKPIQAKYDGKAFLYEVEVLKGLGVNPARTARIKTLEPMIAGQLYLAQGDLSQEESITVTKLFPLLTMSETVPNSEIMGFYFYSDTVEDKLRFVCPYPNVETYKFLPEELIRDCLND